MADELSSDRGFTLLEVLVALAVFSLAALTLLRLEGATMVNARMLEVRTAADIVAQNKAVEALTDPNAPSIGTVTGTETEAGQAWSWVRVTSAMPDAGLEQIIIRVQGPFGTDAATRTVFRRTG